MLQSQTLVKLLYDLRAENENGNVTSQTTSEAFISMTWQSLTILAGTLIVGILPLCFHIPPKFLRKISLFGAVLMCSFILIIIVPEGFEQLEENYPEEELILESFQIGGLSLILGFILLFYIDLLFGLHGKNDSSSQPIQDDSNNSNFSSSDLLSFGFIFHAACDGVAMGAATYSGDIELIVAIFLGIFAHKLVVALCLVVNLMTKTTKKKTVFYLVLFSLACPVAAYIVLGILIAIDAPEESLIPGILIAVSAGTLMYVGMSHSLPEAMMGHSHGHGDAVGNQNQAFDDGTHSDDTPPILNLESQYGENDRNWIDYVGILVAVTLPILLVFFAGEGG